MTKLIGNRNCIVVSLMVLLGIALRFVVMSLGHNNDFESYCVVGEIVNWGKNVYAETHRYNYGPLFFCIQGVCWFIAHLFECNQILLFRILIVSVLTIADLGIMYWLISKVNLVTGIIFFLNPISIFITGFHNQFDNLAVLFGLICCIFYNEEEKLNKKDLWFVLFFTICLITKHIFFIFPFWILIKKGLPFIKRCLYAFVPPFVFLLSFVPFCIGNRDAFEGILKHVFLYRSINNAPLLRIVYEVLNVPESLYFVIYILIMVALGIGVRNQKFDFLILFYLLSMVTFASAISNQYLAIPIVALCVFSKGICRYGYFLYATIFLILNDCGLNYASRIEMFSIPKYDMIRSVCSGGAAYTVLVGFLFVVVVREICLLWDENARDEKKWINNL